MPTQKKVDVVEELTGKLSKAKVIILADYRGLKHKQLEEMRKLLRKTEGEFVVLKNKLFERALGEKAATLKDQLKESSAALFSYADEVAPLKEMLKFFKGAGMGKTKGGLLGTTVLSETDVTRFAELPSRPVLLSMMVGQMKAPISGLHNALSWNLRKLVYALNAISVKKG